MRASVNAKRNVEQFRTDRARFVRITINATHSIRTLHRRVGDLCRATKTLPWPAAVRKRIFRGDFVHPLHKLQHINDGQYGNANSWIAKPRTGGWVQIELAEERLIDRIVWGRDRKESTAIGWRSTTHRVSVDGENWQRLPVRQTGCRTSKLTTPHQIYDFDSFSADEAQQGREWLAAVAATRLDRRRIELEKATLVYAGTFSQPGPTHRLYRGEPDAKREEVSPDAIAVDRATEFEQGFRRTEIVGLHLANWIASRENPLTARVIVNRLWQFHFGTGIVDTPSDFGRNGTTPTHPELLDWLAAELIDSGWSMKHIHRLILNSATWRQDSRPHADAMQSRCGLAVACGDFHRGGWRPKAIRDCILAATGSWNSQMGGPGIQRL